MSESRAVIASIIGLVEVLVVGEWITDTKFEAGGIVMGDVIAQVYVRGPQTQLDGSEVPVLTGSRSLVES